MVRKNIKRNKLVSAKEILNKYNISYQTLNHYTDFGLLPVRLKKNNTRFYGKGIVESRLRKIKKLMQEGYSLRLIRKKIIGI